VVLRQVILLVLSFSSVTISPPMHCTHLHLTTAHIKTRGQNLLMYIHSKAISYIGELSKFKYFITRFGSGLCAKVVCG
jgi:hypothetical protein